MMAFAGAPAAAALSLSGSAAGVRPMTLNTCGGDGSSSIGSANSIGSI